LKISIFGLGYVGAVSAGCLAHEGHDVIGVDPNPDKVGLVNAGRSPIIEHGLDAIIATAVEEGRLRAVAAAHAAVAATELSLICVGTPSCPNGSLDLGYVRRVCEQIGAALRTQRGFHVVVVRSTMLPGSVRELVIPTLEAQSGRRAGADFGVCINPEFLREGTAVSDFYNPPKTVIGASDVRSADLVAGLYERQQAPLVRTEIETAEMVKYTDNAWHALKVGFANEIGILCKSLGVDSHQVMEIFCRDTKLNLSPYYLRPGFAFGGSCLPKDLRALTYKARSLDLDLQLLNSILASNERHIERGLRMILNTGGQRVGMLGLSFKSGTDDLRESPLVEVAERLIGKGYELRVYDRNVSLARLAGANRDISRLLADRIDDVLEHSDTLVIGNSDPEFRDVPGRLRPGQKLIDLVRVGALRSNGSGYEGIGW
jgi:GDP-mannose 6-dehydrogenase